MKDRTVAIVVLFSAVCSATLAVAVLYSLWRMEGALQSLSPPEVTTVNTQEQLQIRIPGRDQIVIDYPNSMSTEVVSKFADAAVAGGGEPFYTCWKTTINGQPGEMEVCTPQALGEEHHEQRVAELQETYPDEGPCE